jgi:hypothetical protein
VLTVIFFLAMAAFMQVNLISALRERAAASSMLLPSRSF